MSIEVTCPTCRRPVEWSAASPYRPFCSKRCKLIDLGEWLSDGYRIPDPEGAPGEDWPAAEEPLPTH